MKKSVVLICLGALLGSQPVWAMTSRIYTRVMDAVSSRDLKLLKQLKAAGVDMNSPDPNGMTPLCETVSQGDYEGYEMLLTQGASPYVPCMRQLPAKQVSSFYANQPAPHTYYTGHLAQAHPVSGWGAPLGQGFELPMLGIGEILLGGVAAAGILTLGHGGSGQGGGGGGDSGRKWDAPLNLDSAIFETDEYKAKQSGWENSINFLGAVNASGAYKRGYTGYNIKRKADGTLTETGEAAIDKTKQVKVAVMDEGVWMDHSDLKDNIGAQYNFVYGVCSDTNNGKCWSYENGSAYLYASWTPGETTKDDAILVMSGVSEPVWKTYEAHYKNYVYSASDANPRILTQWTAVASGGGTLYLDRYYNENNEKWYVIYQGTAYPVTCSNESCTSGTFSVQTGETITTYELGTGLDYSNHGTHVAGLVAATKNDEGMMGVAYNAEIIPVKIDLELVSFDGFESAVQAADIVNISLQNGLGTDGKHYSTTASAISAFDTIVSKNSFLMNAYKAAAANNKILVFAAGNYTSGASGTTPFDPSLYTYAPLSEYFNGTTPATDGKTYNLTNLLVSVVSVDPDKKLASYSAKCGATKDYCVAAPGGVDSSTGQIYSTIRNGNTGTASDWTYEGAQGTSMAAPIVSGALAVIKGAFPHLTNQEVVQILFETADDLGATGVDEIYGHGLINLEAATSPIGLPKIPLGNKTNGEVVVAQASASTVPAAFAGLAKALPEGLVVLDKYNRGFQVPTSAFVHVAKRENKLDGRFKSFMRGNEKVVADTDMFKMAYSERRSKLNSKGMEQGSVSFEMRPSAKWSFKSYYTENTETSGGTYFERLMQSPYAKMKEAWGGAVSYQLGKNWKATVLGQIGQNGFVDEKDLSKMDHNKISLFQSTLQYTGLKKLGLKLTSGVSNEQGATLGMWGRGAFKSGNSKTAFVGAGLTFNLTDALTVEGMYYSGVTHVDNKNSLVKMSDLRSDSFALTAAWQVNEGRTLGLQFVSPLRVRRGTATVDIPVGRDAYQDVVYREAVKADLKPSAREYDIGLYYAEALRDDVHFQSEMGVRLNPDHVAGATPDWRALVGLSLGL